MIKPTKKEHVTADNLKASKGKRSYWKFFNKLRVSKLKEAEKLNIPRLKPLGLNRNFAYLYFVYNFILFVWGTKNDCLKISTHVGKFLKSQLALNLPKEKIKSTHLKKNKAKFLGFEFWQ